MNEESTAVTPDRIVRVTHVETTDQDEWRASIALHGELDVANASDLRAELDRHLDAGRRVLRVDVGGVQFMDSTAVGELIVANERCAAGHGSLILTNVPPRVRRLLSIAGLDRVLLVDTAGDFDNRKPA